MVPFERSEKQHEELFVAVLETAGSEAKIICGPFIEMFLLRKIIFQVLLR